MSKRTDDRRRAGRKILTAVLAVVLAAAVAALAIHAYRGYAAKQKTEDLRQEAEEQPKEESDDRLINPIDFAALQEENPDIYAWIEIPGTDIAYPVLQNRQTTDPYDLYYLDHLVDGTSSYVGSIFTQPVNAADFSDFNTVLYGHNLKNKTMFTHLHDYEEKDFFDGHGTVYIYTPDRIFVYRVFAAVNFSDAHIMMQYDFSDVRQREKFLEDVMGSSGNFAADASPTAEDHLLTLSTCIGGQATRRYLVLAVLQEVQ